PGAAHLLVAAHVDEVRPEDATVVTDERVGAVPVIDPEVLVEVVGDRVPGDVLPPMTLLESLDVLLRSARSERQGRVASVEVSGVGNLIGNHRTTHARPTRIRASRRVRRHLRPVERAVDDELAATLEDVVEAHPSIGP